MRWVVLVTFLAGCATPQITLPDGTKGYAVECKNSLAICYKKASKLCPTGYDIIEDDKNGSASAGAVNGYAAAEAKVNITRVVRCKSGAGGPGTAH